MEPVIGKNAPGKPENHHATEAALTARLERLPRLTRTRVGWMGLLGVLFLCDVADINSLSCALPAIRAEWTLSVGQVGALTSYTFVGMPVGANSGGHLSDRIGRRPTLVAATLFYSVASVACALASKFAGLGVLRALTGFGLQAVTGVLIVYVAEMFPGHLSGRLQSVLLGVGLPGSR